MSELSDVCNVSESALETMNLDQLRQACLDVGAAFAPSPVGTVLIVVFGLLGALVVLRDRVASKEASWRVLGTTFEGLVYGALATYAGLVAGLILADFVLPVVAGLLFTILAAFGVVLGIVAAVRGNGDSSWKAFGIIQMLVLVVGLLIMAGYAFSVPADGPAAGEYGAYLTVISVGLAVAAGINAVLVAVFRGVHWAAGWLLVPLNSSWGFMGNVLGLFTHVASYNFYVDHGKFHKPSDRRYYVCYEEGLSLKQGATGRFAFSQGAVMSADTEPPRRHEAVHVWQHYLAGPLYPISHFAWFIGMIPFALVVALIKGVGVVDGVTAWSYYNNPWEVMAYGAINRAGRDPRKPMVWAWWLAVLCAVLWIGGAIVAFIVFLTASTN